MPRMARDYNHLMRIRACERRAAEPDPDEAEWQLVPMPFGGRKNLNKAGMCQLMRLYQIGSKRAQTILEARDRMPNEEFLTWCDVRDIYGIGPKLTLRLRQNFYLPKDPHDVNPNLQKDPNDSWDSPGKDGYHSTSSNTPYRLSPQSTHCEVEICYAAPIEGHNVEVWRSKKSFIRPEIQKKWFVFYGMLRNKASVSWHRFLENVFFFGYNWRRRSPTASRPVIFIDDPYWASNGIPSRLLSGPRLHGAAVPWHVPISPRSSSDHGVYD